MEIYNQLLQEIKNELSKENVESNENQISLYDLYNFVNDKYADLRSINQNKKAFTNKGLFKTPLCTRVDLCYDETKSLIKVTLGFSGFWIEKEHGSKEFFITKYNCPSQKDIDKFIKKYYDKIMHILFTLEKYGTELYQFEKAIEKFYIECNNYELNIEKARDGNICLNIKLKDDIKYKEMYDRQYYGKDPLIKILNDSKFELAKKIKINVKTLNKSIVEEINKSRENDNKKLVK